MKPRSKKQKSILFITYHFPPDSKIGGKRTARLAKFLSENGWKVAVLTVKERYYDKTDDSYTVDNITIYRTSMFKSIRYLYINLKNRINSWRKSQNFTKYDIRYSNVKGEKGISSDQSRCRKFYSRIKRYILSFLWLPDDHQGWIPFALFKYLSVFRKYDIVYSSSPPKSVPLIPLLATYFTKKFIWVSEFRDPWSVLQKPEEFRCKLTNYLENKWEDLFLKKSSMAIVVTEAMEEELLRNYPAYSGKIKTFYNGFYEDEFKNINLGEKRKDPDKLVITYAGHFSFGRNPEVLMKALSELIGEKLLQREKVEIRFMGDMYVEGKSLRSMAEDFNLSDIVKCMGYVPFYECLEQMSISDILVLFNIDQELQVPAKFFEYLALEKRILSISTGGITDQLVERTGTGISVKPDDISGLKNAIMNIASMKNTVIKEEVRKFNIELIFKGLEDELISLIDSK